MGLNCILCIDTKQVHELYLVHWQWFESSFKVLFNHLQITEYLIQLLDKTRSSFNYSLLLEPRHLNFGKNVYIPFFSVLILDINNKNLSQSTQTQEVLRPPILVSLSACFLSTFCPLWDSLGQRHIHRSQPVNILIIQERLSQKTCENNSWSVK